MTDPTRSTAAGVSVLLVTMALLVVIASTSVLLGVCS